MIEAEIENDKKFFTQYKIYLIIGIMGVCAVLPQVFEKYLVNKEGNIAVSFHGAPTDLILVISIILILIGWFFRKSKVMLTICLSLLVIANGLLLQSYTVVNTEGIERRTYFFTNNEHVKWADIEELNFTVKLGKDLRHVYIISVNPIDTVVVPVLEIKHSNETKIFSDFTTDELLNVKEWLKTQSQPKSYIQPIPHEYQDYYIEMGNSKLEKMNKLFEIKTKINDKPILIN